MGHLIKIRRRAKFPLLWKWEIHKGKLITSGHQSYASRAEAYEAGQAVLAAIVAKEAAPIVLIVEDDLLIRLHAIDMVESAGYDTLDAGNADEAILILVTRSDIHVVFTDIQMPGSMDGLKLAHYVSDCWPPIRIIVTSGGVRLEAYQLPNGSRFLSKLYAAHEVAAVLKEMTGFAA